MRAISAKQAMRGNVPKVWSYSQVDRSDVLKPGCNRDEFTLYKANLHLNVTEATIGSTSVPLVVVNKYLKLTSKHSTYHEFRKYLLEEAALMAILEHQGIVPILGIIESPKLSITASLMPYYENGSLRRFFKIPKGSTLSTVTKLTFCIQIGRGLEYLEQHDIVHRGLSVRTIYLDSKFRCVIGNIGACAKREDESKKLLNFPIESHAREMLLYGEAMCTQQSTIWAYGIAMHVIMSLGQRPNDYLGRVNEQISDEAIKEHVIKEKGIPKQRTNCDVRVYLRVLKPCWQDPRHLRPTTYSIIHELIKLGGIDDFRDSMPKTLPAVLKQELQMQPQSIYGPKWLSCLLPTINHARLYEKEPLDELLRAPSLEYLCGEFSHVVTRRVDGAMAHPDGRDVPATLAETTMQHAVCCMHHSLTFGVPLICIGTL